MNHQVQTELDTRFVQLTLKSGGNGKLTHNLFRFPAKSHPPVIQS